MWYINSMVFNGGDFKNGISFSFKIPPDPPKGAAVAACAAVMAKIEKTSKKIMWYINSMVFNIGDFKNGISFSFRIPTDPPKGASEGGGEAGRGAETYTPQMIMWYINSWVISSGNFKLHHALCQLLLFLVWRVRICGLNWLCGALTSTWGIIQPLFFNS